LTCAYISPKDQVYSAENRSRLDRGGFRPRILHNGPSILLILVTLVLIALIELPIKRLPTNTNVGSTSEVQRRQETTATSILSTSSTFTFSSTSNDTLLYLVPTILSATDPALTVISSAMPPHSYLDPLIYSITSSALETTSLYAWAPQPTSAPPPRNYLSNQTTFTNIDYFYGSYLATIIAVVYKSWWNVFYSGIKLVAPFTELAQPAGTLADNVLNLFYLSSNVLSDPMQSFLHGQWVVFWSSVVLLVTSFMPPLASEVIAVGVTNGCTTSPGPEICAPRLAVGQTAARLLQGLLAFAAVMSISLYIMQRRSRTGLWSDPSRISTMASLLHHPEVVREFQMVDPNASREEMMLQLRGQRYALDFYTTPSGEMRYGLVKVLSSDRDPVRTQSGPAQQQQHRTIEQPGVRSNSSALVDLLFALLLLGITGLITAYYKDGGSDGFNQWMSSQGFGPRFLMTLVGALVDVCWKRIERGMLALLKRL